MSRVEAFNIKDHEDFLRDESRRVGKADSISFPASEQEVVEIVKEMRAKGIPVTVQGARTGLTAGAVPDGGHVLNLSRMNRIMGMRRDTLTGSFVVTVQPGVLLTQLRELLSNKDFDISGWSADSTACFKEFKNSGSWFFSPDPTEASASLGGMVACNASGARSFHYGPARKYVEGINVVITDGTFFKLKRGIYRAKGRSFSIQLNPGRIFEGMLPVYHMPPVKNASGFYAADDMDLIDLFIGSEGTLGIITEIELRLLKEPEARWGMTVFLPSQEGALRFVRKIRGEDMESLDVEVRNRPAAIEYFNSRALKLLRRQKKTNPAFADIPEMSDEFHTAVYIEYEGDSEDAVCDAIMEASEVLAACGGSEDSTWVASNEKEMERLHFFRHAVPESVNLTIDERRRDNPELTKLGTDMAVPDEYLEAVISMYDRKLEEHSLDSVMFGHIGNNHIHVNILPNSMEEYEKGKQLYLEWAREVIKMGGTISAEHGVGKLKTALLREMYGEEGVEQMRAVKRLFDPENMLNRGNMF